MNRELDRLERDGLVAGRVVEQQLYARLRANYLAGRSEEEYLRDSDRIGPYLTLMGGCMLVEQNIRWTRRVRKALEARAGAERR